MWVRCSGESGQELKVGTNSPGGVLPTGSFLMLVQPAFYSTQDHQGWHQPQRAGPSTSVINHENAFWTCLWASLMEAFSQVRFALPGWAKPVSWRTSLYLAGVLYTRVWLTLAQDVSVWNLASVRQQTRAVNSQVLSAAWIALSGTSFLFQSVLLRVGFTANLTLFSWSIWCFSK